MNTVVLSSHRIHTGSLILVNREHGFMGNGQDALVPVQEHLSSIKMQRRAATLLSSLMADIHGWKSIVLVSGWRSFGEQQNIWDDTLVESGLEFTQKYVAVPGHSEHQTGLAVDLGLKQENLDFVSPDFPYSGICQTFRKRAAAYGFIERYPAGKEHITGIGHEPWHFRYVGAPHAEIMVKNDLTLEEYMAFIKQFPCGRKAYGVQPHGQEVLVSYLKAEQMSSTRLEIDGSAPYSISGNNTDGFIITEWRQSNARKNENKACPLHLCS
jgi:D-alanyl-D-alanine dipeptidase/carboxypeptidase